ncbi:MAG: ATP-binding protein [Pyrinomonadaceae bacterium]|nr:ATP-binding protein [Pyrinomonadaceae bacterium]
MPKTWTEAKIQNLIQSGIEESLTLEYKSGEALGRSDQQKREITKDVSAMANSAGGLLIYGIREYAEADKKHLPEKIFPVDRSEIPREWIEQIINSIRPRIDGIVIHSVQLGSGENDAVYVIDIPQSHTAHQANNHRYYKRFNFQSVPMEDYEIRDVMFREQTPDVVTRFLIEIKNSPDEESKTEQYLIVQAKNLGSAYARYVACFVDVPVDALTKIENQRSIKDGGRFYRHRLTNLNQEYADETFKSDFPLLRNMTMSWKIRLKENFAELNSEWSEIKWKVYADNALPKEGKVAFEDIDIVDLRKKSRNL